ncbi:MAG TPA: glycoside hydrolase family 2 protein, partial [Armatimonadota bacterium]|nr:glycoside hydrolase family 2 protein [Armatimonadota bacterium]
LTIDVENPRLWWPRGHGDQNRYTVEVAFEASGETQTVTRRTGVRLVEIDQSSHPATGKHFIIKINGRPIFCKGGNWVPADLLYSTVTPERIHDLVSLAINANFNTLRVWGGGSFASEALCDACDENGILLWHDFLFACAKFPGDHPEFAAEVRREVTYAVRELAHHPAMVVWCGNNEIEMGDWAWGYDNTCRTHPHYAIFHHDIPRIVMEENPAIVEWISSPYSPDYKSPNDPTVGDQHPWEVSLGTHGPDWWHYRSYVDRFPNEGGVLGMSSLGTLQQFLPESERYVGSPSWDHHDNPFARLSRTPDALGRTYESVQFWTGRDPMAMEWENYAFTSSLLQAEGLYEYISNYRRRMFSSSSAIFWMYNDSWPTTHGWTIIDYYLRKKLSFHPVRRAFQPITVVVAEENDRVTIFGVNDTPASWSGELRYGLFTLHGGLPKDKSLQVLLPANASTPLAEFTLAEWQQLGLHESGAFALLRQHDTTVAQHRLFLERFKDLNFAEPDVHIDLRDGLLTLTADTFVWGVCLDLNGDADLADNCFDLLPGIPYTLPWDTTLGEPTIHAIGSRDAVALPANV